MITIFYLGLGIVIIIGWVWFYKKNSKQPDLLVRHEPIIQLDTIDDSINHATPDHGDYCISEIVADDLIEQEPQIVAAEEIINNPDSIEELIMLQLKALPDRPYAGYELLQALTAAELNFGNMGIFHGNNFSVAAATATGSFPLDNMGSFKCLGLMVFMPLKPHNNLRMTFDLMLDTAKQLTEELGGEIYTEHDQLLDADALIRMQAKITQYTS